MPHTKILPLNTDPFIKTYPYNAFYLGILEANGFDINDIIINEFFNLHCYYYKKDWHIDFCGSGFVEKNRFITKYDIKLETVSINQIKNKINNNFYLMLNLNERYLGISEIQWDWDRCHDWLIYGYNDLTNDFYCCGYIVKKGIGEYYATIKVKYENLINSIKTVPKSFTRFRSRKLQNHSLKINYAYKEKCLSKKELIKKLKHFYKPHKIQIHHVPYILNNIDGIDFFIKMFKKKHFNIVSTENNIKIYLQDIRNLYEHKKVVKLILERLECYKDIIEEQDHLIETAYKNLITCAKYNIKPQNNALQKIDYNIIRVENQQKNILKKIIIGLS
ncbi:MAG: hypothetical protein NC213_03485 [Acetobacter sp.]|nr:hypothetical protein [Bacteroides sp.]MCM1340786.1 hypothetical protein [Acetobacter sp.]MCM1432657.1 hypothetical protein [Clostridiales bacterium]